MYVALTGGEEAGEDLFIDLILGKVVRPHVALPAPHARLSCGQRRLLCAGIGVYVPVFGVGIGVPVLVWWVVAELGEEGGRKRETRVA